MLQVDKALREFMLAYTSKHSSFVKSSKATFWPEGVSSQKVMAALTCIEKDHSHFTYNVLVLTPAKLLSPVMNQKSHNAQQTGPLHLACQSKCCHIMEAEHSHLHAFFGTVQIKHQMTVFAFLQSGKSNSMNEDHIHPCILAHNNNTFGQAGHTVLVLSSGHRNSKLFNWYLANLHVCTYTHV